jgi:tripartite ATP-independent transporter DctP family solute receptor
VTRATSPRQRTARTATVQPRGTVSRRTFTTGLAATLAGGCAPRDAAMHLTLGHSLEPTHTVHKAMVHMDERLREHSSGRMVIDVYPSGQLGTERESIELLQIGSLAMTKVSTAPLEGFVPQMRIFNLPYLFRDTDHYFKVLDGDVGEELLKAPVSVRLRGLGYYDAGSRSFYTTDRQVRSPADLKGLKIRVQQSQTAIQMVAALGGSATPIAFGELYTALQQGVVDGAENNPPSFYTSGHFEVARYYTLDEHTAVPDIVLVSEPVWRGLTDEERDWLQLAVDESVVFQRELWKKDTQAALDAVAADGVTILEPDKAPFQANVQDMLASYAKSDLGPLLDRIKNS